MDKYTRIFLLFISIALIGFLFVGLVSASQPFGATLTSISNSTAPITGAEKADASAGNVSLMNLSVLSTTQSWQGYYGNVTGTILLADSANHVMYNWSTINPTGEVYTSTNSTINWASIQCFNYTASGTQFNATGETPGSTNQKGLNLTQFEGRFDVGVSDADSVNKTFNLIGAGSHANFYTANLQFSDSACQTTRVNDNSGSGQAGHFEEVLLYDPSTDSVVFTSILNQDVLGFDNKSYDFEMLVLENGHGSDNQTTPYWFYAELQ